MYWRTFYYDTRLNGNEPSGNERSGDPQGNFERALLEDAGVEEEDGVFGHSNGHGVNGFVYVAGLLSVLELSVAGNTVLLQKLEPMICCIQTGFEVALGRHVFAEAIVSAYRRD